jgi:hypothetical protein
MVINEKDIHFRAIFLKISKNGAYFCQIGIIKMGRITNHGQFYALNGYYCTKILIKSEFYSKI